MEELIAQAKKEGWGQYDADQEDDDLQAAANRLRQAGLIVDLNSGYVGWPSKEAAAKGQLTPQTINDARQIRKRVLATSQNDDTLPVAHNDLPVG